MEALQNALKVLLDMLGVTVYEDGSTVLLGCIFPNWGCED